ncbi:MAG: adenine phosphoribosyltransferase [Rickettsiales bacterium]|nr:adenine phosphoribosyltransferase [Rickettsiales bacterium]|tara:strand:+ start:76 stop:591 length:516 start_codon:yes stop_codon:yes gene_type:complete
MEIDKLEEFISKVPDFPKPGILFYDMSTLICDSKAFDAAIGHLEEKIKGYNINKIAAIDARGFIFGAALAIKMNLGLIMIRKKNKTPGNPISFEYELEYGKDCLEVNPKLCDANNFALIDDVLATGGTANAAINLLRKAGGKVSCFATLVELKFLSGCEKIDIPFKTLIEY